MALETVTDYFGVAVETGTVCYEDTVETRTACCAVVWSGALSAAYGREDWYYLA